MATTKTEGPTTTKKEISERVAAITGLNFIQARGAVQATIDAMTEALNKGERLEFRDFAVFQPCVQVRKGGRNPLTGTKVFTIKTTRTVKFKAGKLLKSSTLCDIPGCV